MSDLRIGDGLAKPLTCNPSPRRQRGILIESVYEYSRYRQIQEDEYDRRDQGEPEATTTHPERSHEVPSAPNDEDAARINRMKTVRSAMTETASADPKG